MFIENIIPTLIIVAGLMAIGSVALVQMVYGRKDIKLSIYTFILMGLSASTLGLKWLEGSGQIHSNQDNTSIFLFICLLLTVSTLLMRRFKGVK